MANGAGNKPGDGTVYFALMRIGDLLEENQKLCREDLAFRREQAEKSEQQQAMILKMFMGPGPTQPRSSRTSEILPSQRGTERGTEILPSQRARRPRHTEPT